MITFWILAAGLCALAVALIVPPLLARRAAAVADPDRDAVNLTLFRQQLAELDADLAADRLAPAQHAAARRDLERQLLADVGEETAAGGNAATTGSRWLAGVLAIGVPAAAVGLYLALGNSAIIPHLEAMAAAPPPPAVTPEGHPTAPDGSAMPPLEVLVERLAERMEQSPGDIKGWLMLGRTYFALRKPEKALYALEKAYGLAPQDPDVMVAYAEAIAANQENRLEGRPAELVHAVLAIAPEHRSARWLDGLMTFQKGDFAAASARWESLLAETDPAEGEAQELRQFIAEARQRGGLPPLAEAAPMVQAAASEAVAPAQDVAPGSRVTVAVSLAERFWKQASVDDTVFVYAKAAAGPPMPLAVKRVRVGELPATLTLDDGMAMMPEMRLSAFPEVIVGARISKSGLATAASGDLEGETGPVKPGEAGEVSVVIDRVRP